MLRAFLILLLISAALSAQNVYPGPYAVIATGGLNLREAANSNAPIVATIPFGGRVTVFDPCLYNRDTIGQLKDYYRLHDHLQDSVAFADHVITGNWCRVTYGQDTGFVFDAYLSDTFDPTEPAFGYDQNGKRIPQDQVLIYPGGGCGGVVYSPSVYQFYGVYSEGANVNSLRAIDVSYLQVYDGLTYLLITTEENRNLRFIIASRQPLPPHTFSGDYFDEPAIAHADPAAFHDHGPADHIDRPLPAAITFDTTHRYGSPLIHQLKITQGGKSQVLAANEYALGIQLEGQGDMDGDGKMDYLIGYEGGNESRVTLYLSSRAGVGEMVGVAASAWFSCCC